MIRVGVPLSHLSPQSGGGFVFQNSIFTEIIRRINVYSSNSQFEYIPIAFSREEAKEFSYNYPSISYLDVSQPPFLRILSSACHIIQKIFNLGHGIPWEQTISGSSITRYLSKEVDLIWWLNPYPRISKIPYIHTVWDIQHRVQPFYPEFSHSKVWLKRDLLYSSTIPRAYLTLVGTKRGAEEISTFYSVLPERIMINPFPCPPIVDIDSKVSESIVETKALVSFKYVIYPAGLWPHKNHITVLKAMAEVVNLYPHIMLVLTGVDYGAKREINDYILQLGIGSNVRLLGFVDRTDLAVLYSQSLALVFPSCFGPDNIPPLEALSYGTSVIVADIPGARDQLKDFPYYFQPFNHTQLSEIICNLVEKTTPRYCSDHNVFDFLSALTPSAYINNLENRISADVPMLRLISSFNATI